MPRASNTPSYRHTQISWVLVSLAVVMVTVILAMTASAGRFEITLLIPLGVVVLAALTFGWMTVSVDETTIAVGMGMGLIRRTVQLNRVQRFEPVRSPWYRGVGVRLYPGGTSFSVWGFNAVEVFTGDGNLRIGSDQPDRLIAAIRAACE